MRIDKFLAEKYGSRTKAAEAIENRLVSVNGKFISPSYDYVGGEIAFFKPEVSFVSNGGYKLYKAINDFNFKVEGKVCADVGASNGGFTDCLLQNGAKKVYAIDVGESQLNKSLLCDRVTVIDNFNARNLKKGLFSEKIDCIVADVSFISLTYILGGISDVLEDGGNAIVLIKPQFECESKKVGKNGIVKDVAQRKKIVEKICNYSLSVNLSPQDITVAPVRVGKNREYLLLLAKNVKQINIQKILKYAEF